jgi:23S rRNA (guanine745-N1)-methyltransferase
VPRSKHSHTTTTSQLASWLRCAHCSQPLEALDGLVLGCAHGHRFDINRRGFLNALDASRGIVGDSRAILEARARFLSLGLYEPIADAVAEALPSKRPLALLDSGAGTGYYLHRVLQHVREPHDAMAADASAAAVSMSVALTGSSGLVADVWQPSPIRDERADVILCVFAPRNSSEFARVLRADGRLLVVTPAGDHLRELRDAGLLIGMQDDKLAKLDEALSPHFALADRTPLSYEIELSTAAASDLTAMGPTGHHERSGQWQGGTVTVSVTVSSFRASG